MIETQKVYQLFQESTGLDIETISTIDHVYSSPPTRLIDGHQLILGFSKPLILIVDTTLPSIKRRKTDLILDTCFYTSTDKMDFLYESGKLSFQSKIMLPNHKKLIGNLNTILDAISYRGNVRKIYFERLEILYKLYQDCFMVSNSPSSLYRNLVSGFYTLFDLSELAAFYDQNAISLYDSNIMNKFIPNLILNSWDKEYGLINLFKHTNIFDSTYFKGLDTNLGDKLNDIDFLINNKDLIANLLSERKIIPNVKIIMWGLLLAGIKHFGNDLGFTSEFARALDLLKIENNISNLQLTEPKRDGTSFVQFNNDNAFRIDNLGRKTKVISTQTKLSRINTFNALWLHFGKKTKDYYQSFLDHNKIHTMEMGKLVY